MKYVVQQFSMTLPSRVLDDQLRGFGRKLRRDSPDSQNHSDAIVCQVQGEATIVPRYDESRPFIDPTVQVQFQITMWLDESDLTDAT